MSQQYPPFPHPPAPPKKRHTGLIVLGVIAVLIFVMFAGCVALIAGSGSDQSGSAPAARPAGQGGDAPQAKPAKVGEAVKVGNLEVTVTKVQTGLTTIGPAAFDQHPDGQYVVVHLTVANTGNQPEFFDSASPLVYDGRGREYGSTPMILDEDGGELFGDINPGNTTKGKLVFDLPKKMAPDRLELHPGLLDEPVTVSLR